MISVEQALQLVENECSARYPESVPLHECLGLILAEDVSSDTDSPPYDKALVDGFAMRSADGVTDRHVLAQVAAGQVPNRPVTPGAAIRIMTGAPIPDGSDCVVMFEASHGDGDIGGSTRPADPPRPGQNILPRGASVKFGDRVLGRGTRIRPAEVGILAELGHAASHVVPRPEVAIIATGDELVPLAQAPQAGQIRNSNGPMLRAAVEQAGACPVDMGIVSDRLPVLAKTIEQALERDVVLLSGGVSAGVLDLVPQVLAQLNVREVFHRVAVKPGKPLWFGVLPRSGQTSVLVFGLPGNPVSGLVCCELFVRPALAALAGAGFQRRPRFPATLENPIRQQGNRETYLPARRQEGDPSRVVAVPWKGSADLASLAKVDALIVVPPGDIAWDAGHAVEVVPI